MTPKPVFFATFFENVDFAEIVLPCRWSSIFGIRALRKSTKKPFENAFMEKAARTTIKNRWFGPSSASRTPPKSIRNRKKPLLETRCEEHSILAPVRPRPPPAVQPTLWDLLSVYPYRNYPRRFRGPWDSRAPTAPPQRTFSFQVESFAPP